MRNTYLDFALPDLDGSELEEVRKVLESNWLTTGPVAKRFEEEFRRAVGAPHAVAVNSCTAAMHLALEALGLERGDVVLTTPFTFAATGEVVRYFDAEPQFVDVEPDTLNLCPRRLAQRAEILAQQGARLKAVIPVHIGGHSCDMKAILEVARRYEMAVVEDAAHAFPAAQGGRTVGTPLPGVRSVCAFSFYATKTITTGEGGMITTDDVEIADRCRVMSLHGISKDAWKRYTSEGSWYYEIVAPGFKYNMTDVAAAIGLAQLRKAERMKTRRAEIAQAYNRAFSQIEELELPAHRADVDHAWHLYILRLRSVGLECSRDQFIQLLKKRNIGVSMHFIPLHVHPYYRERYGFQTSDFPTAYEQYQRAVSLPIYSKMSDSDVEDVIEAVRFVVETHRKPRRASTPARR